MYCFLTYETNFCASLGGAGNVSRCMKAVFAKAPRFDVGGRADLRSLTVSTSTRSLRMITERVEISIGALLIIEARLVEADPWN